MNAEACLGFMNTPRRQLLRRGAADGVCQLRRARGPDDVHEEGLEKGAPTVQPECKTGLGWGGPQEMREALPDKEQEAL